MVEYKILKGTPEDCQKILNQWRHEYDINILGFVSCNGGGGWVNILLTREQQTKEDNI